jgi:hypothetical protein
MYHILYSTLEDAVTFLTEGKQIRRPAYSVICMLQFFAFFITVWRESTCFMPCCAQMPAIFLGNRFYFYILQQKNA